MNNYFTNPYSASYQPSIPYLYDKSLTQTPIDSYTGFIRGNLFDELYHPYFDNEPFPLSPNNEREALLNKIREYNFALIDLNLYLDVFPDDQEKISLFNDYVNKNKTITREYEQRYGPLNLRSEALNSYPWSWIMPPWPWEVK